LVSVEDGMADESVTHAFGGIDEVLKSFGRLLKSAQDSDSLLDEPSDVGQVLIFGHGSMMLTT